MIFKNRRHMIKASRIQSLFTICIVAFLLFFLQILAVASYQVGQSSQEVQQKLGVYFYLDEAIGDKDVVYAEAISLMTDLKQNGLRVQFYSKKQAFDLLAEKLPDVITDLQEFGIENPLPPTLYVMFRNKTEYEYLKSILPQYEHILENLDDFEQGVSFGEQEQRVSTVINLMNTVQVGANALIVILVIIVIAFLWYAIEINFLRFSSQIELEKLLGSPYWKIVASFLLYVASTLFGSFVLLFGMVWIVIQKLNPYFIGMYQAKFTQAVLPGYGVVSSFIFQEIVAVSLCSLLFAGLTLWYMLRKV